MEAKEEQATGTTTAEPAPSESIHSGIEEGRGRRGSERGGGNVTETQSSLHTRPNLITFGEDREQWNEDIWCCMTCGMRFMMRQWVRTDTGEWPEARGGDLDVVPMTQLHVVEAPSYCPSCGTGRTRNVAIDAQ